MLKLLKEVSLAKEEQDEKKAAFIKSSVVNEKDLNSNTGASSKSFGFLKWLLAIIGIILTFLVIEKLFLQRC